MIDRNSYDDFMLKKYEEAWAYIRYTYDTSNRMLWYSFVIIVVVGAITSRMLLFTVKSNNKTFLELRDLSKMDNNTLIYMLVFVFFVLFLCGLFIQVFYVSQRVIIDRQYRVIAGVRNYFIGRAQKDCVNIESYLYFKKVGPLEGNSDPIPKIRLMLPAFVNGVTFVLIVYLIFLKCFSPLWLILIYVIFMILMYRFNDLIYKLIKKWVVPDIKT
jgi:hypothetical protein